MPAWAPPPLPGAPPLLNHLAPGVHSAAHVAEQPPPLAGVPPPQRRYAPTPARPQAASLERRSTHASDGADRWRDQQAAVQKGAARYFGVTWNKGRGRWCAQYETGGKKRAAFFVDEEQAARAYDDMVRAQRPGPPASLVLSGAGRMLKFNFPTDEERTASAVVRAEKRRPRGRPAAPSRGRKRTRNGSLHSSSYHGVTWHKTKRKWQVRMQHQPPSGSASGMKAVTKCIGYFENEDQAARAYDEAARSMHGESAHGWWAGAGRSRRQIILNFPTETEQVHIAQENFRDETTKTQRRAPLPDARAPGRPGAQATNAGETGKTADEDDLLSSMVFGVNNEMEEAARLPAPAATAVPAPAPAGEALLSDRVGGSAAAPGSAGATGGGGAAEGALLRPFSPRHVESGLGHVQDGEDYEQQPQQQQQYRQQLYLLRTALMIGGQELYAQVRQPQVLQEQSGQNEGHLPVDAHHEALARAEEQLSL